MAIYINCIIIERLTKNHLKEKDCCPLCYNVYQCNIAIEYNVHIMLGGPGISETCLRFAEQKPMVTMARQDLKSDAYAPMYLQW